MDDAAAAKEFPVIMRDGVSPLTAPLPPPPPEYSEGRENGMLIERNVAIPMRDGVRLYADIYRPDGPEAERDLPIILAWTPYGKHRQSDELQPEAGLEPGWISRYTGFESPDPAYWTKHGYAVAYVDARGAWWSEGDFHHNGLPEQRDIYDTIEWLGVRPWSNGKVGMSGVSYLGGAQWLVAPAKPPHLAAINPWECFSDWYREFAYHGGIRETGFLPMASNNIRFSTGRTENTLENVLQHPLWDAYWESKALPLEQIEVPAFIVASWSDQGFHTRGTLEAFKRIGSKQKWLDVHGRKKWAYYYDPENVARLRQFFDHFLKGADDTVLSWPKVRIEVRDGHEKGEVRAEREWPLARTQHRQLWLDAAAGSITDAPPSAESEVRYDARTGQAEFEYVFREDTELTGHTKLKLWVEADGADDMDLFVTVHKHDAEGRFVPMVWYALYDTGPVALGWLRASHRALDAQRSRPEQPIHPHTHEERLKSGEVVPVEIEIWPFSNVFRKGERLRVIVSGHDIHTEGRDLPLPFAVHEDTRNAGTHIIRTGGRYDSHLLVPETPPPA